MICVEGTLRTGSYQDRNHQDITHYTTDVQVENVEFTGSKSDNKSDNSSSPAQSSVQRIGSADIPAGLEENFEKIFSDDVPF